MSHGMAAGSGCQGSDIDVMVLQEGGDRRTLFMGGCKRNPDTCHPAQLERQFEKFLEAGSSDSELRELCNLPRRQLLVSPSFTPQARERFAPGGFECVDILDMARMLGVAPPSRGASVGKTGHRHPRQIPRTIAASRSSEPPSKPHRRRVNA